MDFKNGVFILSSQLNIIPEFSFKSYTALNKTDSPYKK
ncbi:hypothetical protein BSBH6_00777 [Bacillus subtilis]|nr:hypothetical protein BSBH6_00777 [Bacillus subtilis]RPK27140.1 hypothetical protein BH5_00775 [Bacillus subtilis]